MRVGLISDIHGNLVSLEAVLADLDRQGVDSLVCLGDVATLGARPSRVVARLMERDCVCLMGNHDSYLLDETTLSANSTIPGWMREQIGWCAARLSSEALEFIGSFQNQVQIALDGSHSLHCVHGSPRSNEEMILATTDPTDLDRMLGSAGPAFLAAGHTHVQMARRHKGTLIINPGSVGEPLEEMPFAEPKILPWSEYAILQLRDGDLSLDFRRVSVDLAAVVAEFERCDMPGAEHWVTLWRAAGARRAKRAGL